MRIAFFHNLPPGGGKRSAFEWVKRLSKKHKIDLYLYESSAEDFLSLYPYVNKIILVGRKNIPSRGYIKRIFAILLVYFYSKKIAKLINFENYDLAFVMQCRVTNSPLLLRNLKIPSLFFCHESLSRMLEPLYPVKWNNNFFLIFYKYIINLYMFLDKASAIKSSLICTSSLYSVENLYKAYGVYPILNYPGVDTMYFKPRKYKREFMVLSVGSLTPSKGHSFVIQSVATINKPFRPRVKVVFGVDNPFYRKKLIELAKKLSVNISMEKEISDEKLLKLYNKSMVTACANHLEPLGLVALESLACGTPVVGVAEAGIRETVTHNKNGLLTGRNPTEFGAAIHKLMQTKLLWSKLSKNGRNEAVRFWTWDISYTELNKKLKLTKELYSP